MFGKMPKLNTKRIPSINEMRSLKNGTLLKFNTVKNNKNRLIVLILLKEYHPFVHSYLANQLFPFLIFLLNPAMINGYSLI